MVLATPSHVSAFLGLWIALFASYSTARDAQIRDELAARIELEARGEFFVVRLFLVNESDAPRRLIAGSEHEKTLAELELQFPGSSSTVVITPPHFKTQIRSRAIKPTILEIPPHEEVLYDVYRLGFPGTLEKRGQGMRPEGIAQMHASLQLVNESDRTQITVTSKPTEFPREILP